MKIVKRFNCQCGYLSPAGYSVNIGICPQCGNKMEPGLYKQFKSHCSPLPYTLYEDMNGRYTVYDMEGNKITGTWTHETYAIEELEKIIKTNKED